MQTECSSMPSEFARVEGRPGVAESDGGSLTSDTGGLLLGASDLDLARRLVGCFRDARDPRLVEHWPPLRSRARVRHALGYRGPERS